MSYGILGLLFRKFITVMSYGRHGVSNNRHLDCLFVPTAKKNMKALHYFPFWRVATADQMKSSHKGQWCRKVFMSWPTHANPDDKKELILCQVIALDQWWHIIYWLHFIDILQKHLFFQQNAFDNVICHGAPHICFGPMRRSSCYHCVQVCTPPPPPPPPMSPLRVPRTAPFDFCDRCHLSRSHTETHTFVPMEQRRVRTRYWHFP